MKPLISIITSSFNQGYFIEETINSVLSQSYDRIQYIVVDSCSTDATAEVLDRYKSRIDILLVEKDRGSADGLNKGFAMAEGDYLAFINSDDCYKTNAIDVLVEQILCSEADCVYSDVEFIDHNSKVITPYSLPKAYAVKLKPIDLFARSAIIPQQGSLWSRRIWDYGIHFNANNKTCWDFEYFSEALAAGFKFSPVYDCLASFRMHSQSITGESIFNEKTTLSRLHGQRIADHQRVNQMFTDSGLKLSRAEVYYLKTLNLSRRVKRCIRSGDSLPALYSLFR
jgi:glycosyltransferase involved in cell wall biosynthesis